MSGNYNVTNVTANDSVNNTSSFKSVQNGNKQFIGTGWNSTSYVKNDKNKGTVFEDGKDITLRLNARYNNGGNAVFENIDSKHTGISYDLLDKFIEAAADGILEDVDHKGYTRENMINFGKTFDKLKKNNDYNRMRVGAEMTFTAEELKELYTAAGFKLVKKEEQIVEDKNISAQETPVIQEQAAVDECDEIDEIEKEEITEENKIAASEVDNKPKELTQDEKDYELLVKSLGLPPGTQIKVEYELRKYIPAYPDVLDYAVGTVKINGKRRQHFMLSNEAKQLETYVKDYGINKKWVKVAPRNDFETQEEYEEQLMKDLYDIKVTKDEWQYGTEYVQADKNKPEQFHGRFTKYKTKDGIKCAQVDIFNNKTQKNESKYYEVKVIMIDSPNEDIGRHASLIPDFDKQIKFEVMHWNKYQGFYTTIEDSPY